MKRVTFPYALIGEEITIVKATNASLVGLHGRVIDETRETLVIEVNGVGKKVLKRGLTIKIGEREVDGNQLLKRPEDRIKG